MAYNGLGQYILIAWPCICMHGHASAPDAAAGSAGPGAGADPRYRRMAPPASEAMPDRCRYGPPGPGPPMHAHASACIAMHRDPPGPRGSGIRARTGTPSFIVYVSCAYWHYHHEIVASPIAPKGLTCGQDLCVVRWRYG